MSDEVRFGARDRRAGDQCCEKLGLGCHFVPVRGTSYSGVLGMGMGRSRAKTVAQTPGAKLQVVCDLREERVRPVPEELGCDWTVSPEAVLRREDVDVVYVMLPSGLHGDFAIQAMRAGKHAITTKPMDIRKEPPPWQRRFLRRSSTHCAII